MSQEYIHVVEQKKMAEKLELRTIKKAAEVTGASERFLVQLLQEGKLTRWKINTATYISLVEFESIAIRVSKKKLSSKSLSLEHYNGAQDD